MSNFFSNFRKLFNPILGKKTKKQQNTTIKTSDMAMYNYGVGGNEIKVDANEAIQEIQENRSLIVSQLTSEEPMMPEIVRGLKTIEDVFRHFEPSVSVQHEKEDGTFIDEEFRFQTLGDFTPKSLTQNSDYLQQLSIEQEQYNKILRQLKNNKILRNMLENEQTKAAFVEVLKEVAKELEK
ncbi:type VI secretion system contractile sheath small subunit [Elizabethkingia meningoseptica]|nr:type VI secretion system contractile sheath small subunit [Elizabethkingia meningoseptica]EJK5327295.1 type VI secretion system contractile sheath small subunit [Elizabethkingia meningoseptica]MBG0515600.1 type VI secretion system contractile sheath small subunit [Elizabethkingia meningoseptica]MDE5429907.1 type VI secretion system contractile sheath small subunit [Elizabethkingia meningoseptica]MDE5434033.1 type VI secretion system contractile sheath small subunit [Elizabethkingia meningose